MALPITLREKIYRFLSFKDLHNVALTSKKEKSILDEYIFDQRVKKVRMASSIDKKNRFEIKLIVKALSSLKMNVQEKKELTDKITIEVIQQFDIAEKIFKSAQADLLQHVKKVLIAKLDKSGKIAEYSKRFGIGIKENWINNYLKIKHLLKFNPSKNQMESGKFS